MLSIGGHLVIEKCVCVLVIQSLAIERTIPVEERFYWRKKYWRKILVEKRFYWRKMLLEKDSIGEQILLEKDVIGGRFYWGKVLLEKDVIGERFYWGKVLFEAYLAPRSVLEHWLDFGARLFCFLGFIVVLETMWAQSRSVAWWVFRCVGDV